MICGEAEHSCKGEAVGVLTIMVPTCVSSVWCSGTDSTRFQVGLSCRGSAATSSSAHLQYDLAEVCAFASWLLGVTSIYSIKN